MKTITIQATVIFSLEIEESANENSVIDIIRRGIITDLSDLDIITVSMEKIA